MSVEHIRAIVRKFKLRELHLPESGVISYGEDSISVRVFGPENNDHWSKVSMDLAVERADQINYNQTEFGATTTTEVTKKGTEVVVTLHKI